MPALARCRICTTVLAQRLATVCPASWAQHAPLAALAPSAPRRRSSHRWVRGRLPLLPTVSGLLQPARSQGAGAHIRTRPEPAYVAVRACRPLTPPAPAARSCTPCPSTKATWTRPPTRRTASRPSKTTTASLPAGAPRSACCSRCTPTNFPTALAASTPTTADSASRTSSRSSSMASIPLRRAMRASSWNVESQGRDFGVAVGSLAANCFRRDATREYA